MKTETVIVLKADEGMYLTNGETYGKTVVLGEWDKPENYHEITEEEYNKVMVETEENVEE
jgi:hypothetical protein